MSEQEFANLVHQSSEYVKSQIASCRSEFAIGKYARYDWDQWRGELIFSDNGNPKVIAKIQFVGSMSRQSNTWLWAWANPSFIESVRRDVLAVKEFGERNGLPKLTESKWKAEETDGWEMTAVAARLLEAKGAYRTPDDDGFTFMVFTDIARARERSRVIATFVCSHVVERGKPVLLVLKEVDGDVQLLCGRVHKSSKDIRVVHLEHLLELDRSLEALGDLPLGWQAERTNIGGDWIRTAIG